MSASLSDITAFSGQGFLMEASAMLNGEAPHAVLCLWRCCATPGQLTSGGNGPLMLSAFYCLSRWL